MKSGVKIAGETVGTAVTKGEGGAMEGFINGAVNEIAKKATGKATDYLLGGQDMVEVDLQTYASDVEINGHSMLDVLMEMGVENEADFIDYIYRTGDSTAEVLLEGFREHNIDMFCAETAKEFIDDVANEFVTKPGTKPVREGLYNRFRTFFGYGQENAAASPDLKVRSSGASGTF